MRYIGLVLMLVLIPALMAWIKGSPKNRRNSLALLTLTFFLSGVIPTDVSFIAWPLWSGVAKGTPISISDAIALALILTRPTKARQFPLAWLLVAYAVPVFLSLIPSTVRMATFFYIFQFLRLVVLFIAIVPEIDDRRSLQKVLTGLGMGLSVQAAFVVYQKATGVVQAHGTMIHQNFLGFMTELSVIPLIAALFAGERDKWVRIGAIAGLIIVTAGGSRATIALTFGGLSVFAVLSLLQGRTPVKMRLLGIGLLAAVLVAPVAVLTLHARFGQGSVMAEETQRSAMERAARAMAADNPLGVGSNLYVLIANSKGYSVRSGVAWGGGNLAVQVHNGYLLARAETGWAGQLTFLMLFLAPAIIGLKHAFKYANSYDGSVALGSSVAMLVVSIHSNYEFSAYGYVAEALIFTNIAIVSGLVRARRLDKRPLGNKIRKVTVFQ